MEYLDLEAESMRKYLAEMFPSSNSNIPKSILTKTSFRESVKATEMAAASTVQNSTTMSCGCKNVIT